MGVAQANLACQQTTCANPQIAGLYSSGFNTALSAAQQQQQTELNAAYGIGNLGVAGQNAALQGGSAMLSAGTLEQQTQQAQDTANYNQYSGCAGFSLPQAGWLAGISTGVGGAMGGTTSGYNLGQGSTTAPPPNPVGANSGFGHCRGWVGSEGRGRPRRTHPASRGWRHNVRAALRRDKFVRPPAGCLQRSFSHAFCVTQCTLPKPPQQDTGGMKMVTDALGLVGKMKGDKPAAGYYGGSPETTPEPTPDRL